MAITRIIWSKNSGADFDTVYDTTLAFNQADTNLGTHGTPTIRAPIALTLFKSDWFDVINGLISDESQIVSAGLNLFVRGGTGGTTAISAFGMRAEWWELASTWNEANASASTAWGEVGARSKETDYYATAFGSQQVLGGVDDDTYFEVDVTDYVKAAYSAGMVGYEGLIVYGTVDVSLPIWSNQGSVDGERPIFRIAYAPGVFNETPSDTFTMSESGGPVIHETSDSVTDGILISGYTGGSGWEQSYTPFDGLELGDNNTGSGVEFDKLPSSGIVFTDTFIGVKTTSGGASDIFLINASAAEAQVDWGPSISDTFTMADSGGAVAQFAPSAIDGLTFSEEVSGLVDFVQAINDGIDFSDSSINFFSFSSSATDGFTFSEAVSALNNTFNPAVTAGFVFTDASYPGFNEFITDGFVLNVSAGYNQTVYAEEIGDAFIMIETGTIGVKTTSGAGFDGIDFSDSSLGGFESDDVASDIFLLNASAAEAQMDFADSITDTFTVADSGGPGIMNYVNIIGDGFLVSAGAPEGIIELLEALDGFNLGDTAISPSANFVDSIADGILFADPTIGTFAGAALTITGKKIILTFVGLKEK